MTETMTTAGLDVHARSIDAAALDVVTGELRRKRFGAAPGPVIDWLHELPRPLRCWDESPRRSSKRPTLSSPSS